LWCVYFSPNALASHTTHQRAPWKHNYTCNSC
jgi:hypothetical protein